ncbi:DUF2157 domain-containing protein [Teredinibacter purpureus]|uniref:DUF2157 domain-containing protein n=1 Tax=Teredinibacter purpureus TaxID=2731756 RepID=UPI0005F7EDA6|nr:DUF2157 domain-containing protein [Teredinibacter purpureus]
MNKTTRWLFNELALWQTQGIIDNAQAQRIQSLYREHDEPVWGKIIFAAIGSIIFGLGIILLFAYNWADMHRFSKMAVVLLSLITAHALGYYYSGQHSNHPKVGESLHVLGTMLFGAGIWLVAQIYHIDEHYPNALLVWALGALAIAWTLPSLVHTLLSLTLIALWHSFEVFNFQTVNHWANWIVLVGIIPLAWFQRSRSALFMSLSLFIFTFSLSYGQTADSHEATVLTLLLLLSGGCILTSFVVTTSSFPESHGIFRTIGVSVFVITLYIFTFSAVDNVYFRGDLQALSIQTASYFLLPIVYSVSITTLLLTRYRHSINNVIFTAEIALILGTLTLSLLSVFKPFNLYEFNWILYNVLFLSYSILLIYRGTHQLVWQAATVGTIMLSAFTFARFIDLFDSLLIRAAAFLVIGALLFFVGIYYSRQKLKQREQFATEARPHVQ